MRKQFTVTSFAALSLILFLTACEPVPPTTTTRQAIGGAETRDVVAAANSDVVAIPKSALKDSSLTTTTTTQPPAPEPAAPQGYGITLEEIVDAHFGSVAPQAHRIVRCESNWDPNAVSPTNDHGLFQINNVHRNTFAQVTGQPWSARYDPWFNTMYAKYLYDESGWRPWSCRKAL